MKNLLTLTSILFFFSCDITEPTIHGCLDSQACNYNSEANIDNNSCEYIIDCEGICGGVSEIEFYWYDEDSDGLGSGEPSYFCNYTARK